MSFQEKKEALRRMFDNDDVFDRLDGGTIQTLIACNICVSQHISLVIQIILNQVDNPTLLEMMRGAEISCIKDDEAITFNYLFDILDFIHSQGVLEWLIQEEIVILLPFSDENLGDKL